MVPVKILKFLVLFVILHQNSNHALVFGLSSFNDYNSRNEIFEIIVNYDELLLDSTTTSPSTDDFTLDVVSFPILILSFIKIINAEKI